VLGVGGAASIAEEDELAAVANGGGGAHRKLSDAGDQRVRKRCLTRALSPTGAVFFDVRGHELLTENDFRAVTNHRRVALRVSMTSFAASTMAP